MILGNSQVQYHRMVCHLEWELRLRTFQATTERYSLDTIDLKHQILLMDLSLLETQDVNRLMTLPGEENHQRTHPAPF